MAANRSWSNPHRPRSRRRRRAARARTPSQAIMAASVRAASSTRCEATDDAAAPSRSPPTVPASASPASGTAAVGSNACQPVCGNHTSTQAWASRSRTFQTPDTRSRSPGMYPVTSRVGTPWLRSMIARLEAICSQNPRCETNRKSSTASAPSAGTGASRSYSVLAASHCSYRRMVSYVDSPGARSAAARSIVRGVVESGSSRNGSICQPLAVVRKPAKKSPRFPWARRRSAVTATRSEMTV